MRRKYGLWLAISVLIPACLIFGEQRERPSGANQDFQAAVAFYQRQQFGQAQQILAKLLDQYPGDFELNELMGLVYTGENNQNRASTYLAKAVQIKPQSAEARMYLAANLVELHQNAKAESEFKKAAAIEPASYETNHNLGEFYIGVGKLGAAIPYLAKAQQISPSSVNNGYDLALAQIKTGEFADAKTNLEHLLTYQNSADLHSLLGTADEHAGQSVQAATEYQTAAHMDPSESNIFAWGSELLLHHTLELAIQVLGRGVQLYPRSARMQVGYGIALYSRGHYQDAIDAFCHAIDVNPKDPRPYTFLGKIYDVSPLQAAAVTGRFARYAALQPHNAQALYYYAMSLWKASRSENQTLDLPKVRKLLESAVAIEPAFAEAHLQLGILYAGQRQWEAAISQYRQAIRRQPDLADAHYRLGEAMVRAGQRAAAQNEFQTFNRLHQQQVKDEAKQRSEITQFVYTSGAPAQNAEGSKQ
ncbi:MAG: tetratricopeptide repeat protein [Terriglobia bacterium]